MGVSHLLHTWWPSHLRALLYKLGNVEGEGLNRLLDLHRVLPGCYRPDPVVVFLQSAEQTHARLGVGPTPVLPQPLFPQRPPGLLPVLGTEGAHLPERRLVHRGALLAPRCECALRLGCAVRMVEESDPLPDPTAEAWSNTLLLSFPRGPSLLCLQRDIGRLLEECPTHCPARLGHGQEGRSVFCCPARRDLPAGG